MTLTSDNSPRDPFVLLLAIALVPGCVIDTGVGGLPEDSEGSTSNGATSGPTKGGSSADDEPGTTDGSTDGSTDDDPTAGDESPMPTTGDELELPFPCDQVLTGVTQWTQIRGQGNALDDRAYGLTALADGGVVVVGGTEESFGSGSSFIARYGADGTELWTSVIDEDPEYVDRYFDVAVLPSGNLVAVGQVVIDLEFVIADGIVTEIDVETGMPSWTVRHTDMGEPAAVAVTSDDDLVVGGEWYNHPLSDLLMVGLDAAGGERWFETIPGEPVAFSFYNFVEDVMAMPDGSALFVGTFEQNAGISGWLGRRDAQGVELWTRAEVDRERYVAVGRADDASIVVVALHELVGLDDAGNDTWSTLLDLGAPLVAEAAAIGSDAVYLTGRDSGGAVPGIYGAFCSDGSAAWSQTLDAGVRIDAVTVLADGSPVFAGRVATGDGDDLWIRRTAP